MERQKELSLNPSTSMTPKQKSPSKVQPKRKVKFDSFIQPEIDYIIDKAHFTDEQLKVFNLLLDDNLLDVGRAEKINVSISKFYTIKQKVILKVIKVLQSV